MKLLILLIVVFVNVCHGLIHNLKIKNDDRAGFFIENFGFESGGKLSLNLTNFQVNGKKYIPSSPKTMVGFLIKRTDVDSTLFLEDHQHSPASCLFQNDKIVNVAQGDKIVPITGDARQVQDFTIGKNQQGFYNTYFINCLHEPVSFNLRLVQYNVVNGVAQYLATGRVPLPAVYGVLAGVYLVMLLAWLLLFLRARGAKVNRVHHLMTGLLLLKMLALVFHTVDLHFTMTTGEAGGWALIYYMLTAAKTMTMFLLIALIGTGWSFVKPFLSSSDKQILLIVLPLQVLDNIALLIIEESAPGSSYFANWKDVFRIVDILCCGAVLIPIIWSIKHLREAAQIDGKAARNVRKLSLFRRFYLSVVSYIYFTRIIIYLLNATLPFRLIWLGNTFAEVATVVFFGLTGFSFRPAADNPYFELKEEDRDEYNDDVPMKGVDV